MVAEDKQNDSIVQWIAIGAILALALGLRLYRLDAQSLWFDEVYTYLSSKDGVMSILFNPFDVNLPPLYYLIIHGLLEIGRSDFLLRLPSVIFGTLSIAFIYDIVRKDFGVPTALITALLLALSPFHVWYSQEARPYMQLLFLAVMAIWCFRESLRRPHSRALPLGFVLCSALACYTHLVGLSLGGVFLGYVILFMEPALRRRYLGYLVMIFVLI